jgi:ribosomal protein L37E
LLLYKEALARKSPPGSNEVLIKAKARPVVNADGSVGFVGVGKKTADVATIRERFDSLGIRTDWDRFTRIATIRNEVEHYYPHVSQDSLQELIASAFWIIRAFIVDELKDDPAILLGAGTWKSMLDVAEVFEAERKACDEALDGVPWESDALRAGLSDIRCRSCGSSLFRPRDAGRPEGLDATVLRCAVCGEEKDADEFVPEAVAEALASEAYLVYDDGGDEPYVECPECGLESYVVAEQRCARCGASYDATCARCGAGIPPSEISFAPFCAYCSHVMSKDD